MTVVFFTNVYVLLQDLTSIPPTSGNITETTLEKVLCENVLPRSDQSPITFQLEGRDDSMIDTKNIQMCLQTRVRMVDPATENLVNLPAQENVVPYNGFLYTFWKVLFTPH